MVLTKVRTLIKGALPKVKILVNGYVSGKMDKVIILTLG